MFRRSVSAAVVLLMCSQAHASGALSCSAEGGQALIELNAGVTRGMGGPIFSFDGSVAVDNPKVAKDLRKTAFEMRHVAQYWLDGEELRLLLYRERGGDGPFGEVEVEVRTTATEGEEGAYNGRYKIKIFEAVGGGDGKTFVVDGDIACSAE